VSNLFAYASKDLIENSTIAQSIKNKINDNTEQPNSKRILQVKTDTNTDNKVDSNETTETNLEDNSQDDSQDDDDDDDDEEDEDEENSVNNSNKTIINKDTEILIPSSINIKFEKVLNDILSKNKQNDQEYIDNAINNLINDLKKSIQGNNYSPDRSKAILDYISKLSDNTNGFNQFFKNYVSQYSIKGVFFSYTSQVSLKITDPNKKVV